MDVPTAQPSTVNRRGARLKHFLKIAALPVCFFSVWFSAIFALAWFDESNLRGLAKRGRQNDGKIVAIEPDNHRSVRYQFVVAGQTYSGIDGVSGIDLTFDQITIGSVVP